MADSDALHVTRTKAFSAVGGRKHWKKDSSNLLSGAFQNSKSAYLQALPCAP
ncbi:MAG: hypothetical protein ACREXG_03180 [Polaromonas sp.]